MKQKTKKDLVCIVDRDNSHISRVPEGKVAVPIKDGLRVLAVPLTNHDENFERMLSENKPKGAEAYDEKTGESYHAGARILTVHAVQYFKFRDVIDYIRELQEVQIPFEGEQ